MLPRPSRQFNPYNYSHINKEATTKHTKNTKNCIFRGNNSRSDALSFRR